MAQSLKVCESILECDKAQVDVAQEWIIVTSTRFFGRFFIFKRTQTTISVHMRVEHMET